MNHPVKEHIIGDVLYIPVDPQPYAGLKVGITYPPPIRINDTVYQSDVLDKTFKVIGVEVMLMPTYETVPTLTNPPIDKPIHRDKWLWKYNLEEIK